MPRNHATAPAVSLMALGVWLGVSAFWWPHSAEQFVFALMAGLLCALVGLRMLGNPRRFLAPYLIVAWLVLGIWFLPALSRMTLYNHVIVAAGILAFTRLAWDPAAGQRGGNRR